MQILLHFVIPPLYQLIISNYLPSEVILQCGETHVILPKEEHTWQLLSFSKPRRISAFLSTQTLKQGRHRLRFNFRRRENIGFYFGLSKPSETAESQDIERGNCCWLSSQSIYKWGKLFVKTHLIDTGLAFEIQIVLSAQKVYGRNVHRTDWTMLWTLDSMENLHLYLGILTLDGSASIQFSTFDIDSLH